LNIYYRLFEAYVTMDETIQEAVQELITALIRPMGSNNASLLTILRHFPAGSEGLVLRVVTILTAGNRPSAALVALMKTLVAEKDLGFNFIIPIIGEMDKASSLRQL
jgi:symplekin